MKKLIFSITTLFVLASCVSKKDYLALSNKYDRLDQDNAALLKKNQELIEQKLACTSQLDSLMDANKTLDQKYKALQADLAALQKEQKNLKEAYNDLSTNSSSTINKKVKENQKLLTALQNKEQKLLEEQAALNKLKLALEARSKRINDLEALIASKEKALEKLKSAISDALDGFEGKGLTVENRGGKIYVSMENKLLFKSGQWSVGSKGKDAVVKLAEVLVNNPSIEVLIEGHTDNDPYHGGVIVDNWDLSVKRATAIVRILQDYKVSPQQMTAAGRSEYIPVATNQTNDGKAKNRRIEIVLSPNLDELNSLLNE